MQAGNAIGTKERLKEFASYILENHLEQFTRNYITKVREMKIPALRVFFDMPDNQLMELSRKSVIEFLESLKNGTALERLQKSLKNWEEDKLAEGLSKDDILPSDIIQLTRAQSVTMVSFVPGFTSSVEEAISIIQELSSYFTKVQEKGFDVFQRIRQDYEAKLSRSEERFRIVVDSVKEYAIFRLDTEGYIRTWNLGAQRINGYTEKEIIGKHFSIFYPEEDKEDGKPARELKIALATGTYEEEGWRISKSGTRFWSSVVITPIFSSSGKHVGFVKVTRDQTDRMRFIQALQQKNEELASYIADIEQFAYISSHDLKEPLRMVASYTQLLQKNCQSHGDAVAEQYQEFINEGVNRMYSLLNDLIEYARIRRDAEIQEKVDLNKILEDVKVSMSDEIEETHAKISCDSLPVIQSSPRLMRLLFINLLDNAIKFRKKDEPPVIEVKASKNNHHWTFSVKDNGIGIDPVYHENIFVIFKRLHPRELYPGTGMGLAICKKIVEMHSGWIWLESEPGKGSTFYFTLPDKQEEEIPAQ